MPRKDGKKITNKYYKDFLEKDYFETIPKDKLIEILDNISRLYKKGKFRSDVSGKVEEARAFMILLWITGARPAEVLKMAKEDIEKRENIVMITIPGGIKHSKTRTLHVSYNDKLVKELWRYAREGIPIMMLFPHLQSERTRSNITYTKKVEDPTTGEITKIKVPVNKTYTINTGRIYYYFKKYVEGVMDISPYYFRHNRFTVAAEKLDYKDLMKIKGSRSISSVEPYVHATKEKQKKWSRELLK
ncbi:MAG: tyrosine-type recombinase/integrase [Petrotogales bacterium]